MKVACPTCGADVDFRYDDSFVRVCDSCRSAVVRGDRGAETLGKVADLVPTASPLKLFAEGRYQGQGFMLVGHAQYRHPAGGVWDEWFAKLDDSSWGWLAEAQGRFYLTFETVGAGAPPPWDEVFPGATVELHDGGPRLYTVGERGVAQLAAAEGEIPFRFVPGAQFGFADLADGTGRFATIDYGDPDEPVHPERSASGASAESKGEDGTTIYLGRQVSLGELKLAGGEESAAAARAPAAGKRLPCPSCGGSVDLRLPDQSMRVVCPYCSTMLSCEGDLAILGKLKQAKDPGVIKLGSKGTFDGVAYTVIARLRRKAGGGGVASMDDDEDGSSLGVGELWTWDEYLLYEPSVGFRWLVESSGHWSLVTTLPPGAARGDAGSAHYDDRKFRVFDRGTATVIGVWGEVYWRVAVGEQVETADYVAPPAMLSSEASDDEVNWSLGVYQTPDEINRAFGGVLTLPPCDGVGAAQPFKHRHALTTALLLVIALGVLTAIRGGLIKSTKVLHEQLALDPPPAEAMAEIPAGIGDLRLAFTEPFTLSARRNIEISLSVNVDNNWVFVAGDLVNETTGKLRTFEKDIAYYHGYEGGESWSEGGQTAHIYLPAMDSGRHVLRLEVLQAPGANVNTIDVKVRQGVFRFTHVIVALVCIGIPGLILALWSWSFERRRWKNSDYGGGGDD